MERLLMCLLLAVLLGMSHIGKAEKVPPVSNSDSSPYAALREALLSNYDPWARPGTPDAPIIVQMRLMVNAMQVEEWNIALHADTFPFMIWQDDRLTWDPSNFSGINVIRFPPTNVWTPDITLFNEIPTYETNFQAQQKSVLIFSNGTVLWVPSVSLLGACPLDLSAFPRDEQTCSFIFGSWTYDKTEIDIQLMDKPIQRDNFVNTSPWTVVESSAARQDVVYPDVEGVYPNLSFNFTLRRRIGSYCLTLYLPILVSVMGSLGSWIVAKRGASGAELLIGSLLNAGLLVATLLYHGVTLGVSASGVPAIMQFIGVLAALESLALPVKAGFSGFMKGLLEAKKAAEAGIGPVPRLASAFLNFNFHAKSKEEVNDGMKSALLSSELEAKRNIDDWTHLASSIWGGLASCHIFGVLVASLVLLVA